MTFKPIRIITLTLTLLFSLLTSETQSTAGKPYLNPTGTYSLVSKVKIKDEDTFGVTGDIQVKALSTNKIVIALAVNVGAPSYNSGSFSDTLNYRSNSCTYRGDESDTSCQITFKFNQKGVTVTQRQNNLNFGCGFGHGVFADGFYKKKSSKVTFIKDPKTGEITFP